MNYRHSFHAGNFADLVKHALVLWLLAERQARGPVTVLDTHAGAGLYDLEADGARSKEAEAGVARLMAAEGRPAEIEALAQAVVAFNPDGRTRWYPGSPVLVAARLRDGDAYRGFELRDEVAGQLIEALEPYAAATGAVGDGYEAVADQAGGTRAPLVLIDPPFEQPDDYIRSVEATAAVVRAAPGATVAIWTPLKDLETFDGFIRRLESVRSGTVLVAEARLRPLTDPMKMNGCAMVVVNPSPGAESAARAICDWVAETLGDHGRAEVWTA